MATIKEIAALAGVSRGTVDRVLNDRGAVNPETAEKIRKIAKELDYKPNRAGLVLAAQKKRLKLGVILFSTGNPFFQDVLAGIDEKAEELANYNCTVITKQISFGVEAQLQTIDELLAEEVNGIAMTPYNDARIRNRINALYEQGIPVVTLNTDIENSRRLAYVGSNYTRSGATAAGLLQLMTLIPSGSDPFRTPQSRKNDHNCYRKAQRTALPSIHPRSPPRPESESSCSFQNPVYSRSSGGCDAVPE
jgi:LacI family transcriptional regulator